MSCDRRTRLRELAECHAKAAELEARIRDLREQFDSFLFGRFLPALLGALAAIITLALIDTSKGG